MAKILYAKNGRPYKRLADGRVRFIKGASKGRKVTKRISSRGVTRVARRRSSKKRVSRKSSMFGRLNKPVVGGALVVAYESFISPMIPVQGVLKDGLELLGGYMLSKKRGAIGAFGNSMMVINSYQIISGLAGNKLQGLFGGTTQATSTSGSW